MVYIFRFGSADQSFVGSFVVFVKRVKKDRRFHVNKEKTSSSLMKSLFTPAGNVANNKITMFRYDSLVEKSSGIFGEIINVGLSL